MNEALPNRLSRRLDLLLGEDSPDPTLATLDPMLREAIDAGELPSASLSSLRRLLLDALVEGLLATPSATSNWLLDAATRFVEGARRAPRT